MAELRSPTFEALSPDLPESIHVLSVEPLPDQRILLRLEHLHTSGPPVTVNLSVQFIFQMDLFLHYSSILSLRFLSVCLSFSGCSRVCRFIRLRKRSYLPISISRILYRSVGTAMGHLRTDHRTLRQKTKQIYRRFFGLEISVLSCLKLGEIENLSLN